MALSDWVVSTKNHFDVEEVGETIQGNQSLRFQTLNSQHTDQMAPKVGSISIDRTSEYRPSGITNGRMRCIFRRNEFTTSEIDGYAGFYFLSNTTNFDNPSGDDHYYLVCNRNSGIRVIRRLPGGVDARNEKGEKQIGSSLQRLIRVGEIYVLQVEWRHEKITEKRDTVKIRVSLGTTFNNLSSVFDVDGSGFVEDDHPSVTVVEDEGTPQEREIRVRSVLDPSSEGVFAYARSGDSICSYTFDLITVAQFLSLPRFT